MTYQEEVKEACKKAKNEIKTKYYCWEWCFTYGWRQTGSCEGYNSIEELKDKCASTIGEDSKGVKYDYSIGGPSENWKILKAEVIESKK